MDVSCVDVDPIFPKEGLDGYLPIGWIHSLTTAYDNIGRCRRQRLFWHITALIYRLNAIYRFFFSFLTTSCVVTKTISVALLLYPGLGLALSESEQWRSYSETKLMYLVETGVRDLKVSKYPRLLIVIISSSILYLATSSGCYGR